MSRNNTVISFNALKGLGYVFSPCDENLSFTVWDDGEVETKEMLGVNINLEQSDMLVLNEMWQLEFFKI